MIAMGHTRTQYETRIRSRLGDLGLLQHVDETQFPIAIEEALLTFSKDRPRQISETLSGDGATRTFDLSSLFTSWATGWSRITVVEYPAGEIPASRLDPQTSYELDDETGILTFYTAPDTGADNIRVSYLATYPFPDDTAATDRVPDVYFPAVTALAAASAARSKALEFARQQSTSVAGDLYRRDPAPLFQGASDLEKVYRDTVLGRPASGEEGAPQVAMAVTDVDVFPASLFHRRSEIIAEEGFSD